MSYNQESEYEKMFRGIYYLSNDPFLVKMRNDAELLYIDLNKLSNSFSSQRNDICGKLLGEIGENSVVRSPFYCDYGKNIYIGKNVVIKEDTIILDVNRVIIGDNTVVENGAQIYTAGHPINPKERMEGYEFGKEIVIGKNCILGTSTIICPGLSIGDNVHILPGSVVTRNLISNVIAGGNPCKIIQKIDID